MERRDTRPVPANIDAERAVLGSILMDRDAIMVVAPRLQASHFLLEQHRWIYAAAASLLAKRVPPDLQTIGDELRIAGHSEAVGGQDGLIALTAYVPTSYHVEYYAEIVQRTAKRRQLIAAGLSISQLAHDEEMPLEEVEAKALGLLAMTDAGDAQVISHTEVVNGHLETYQQRQERSPWRMGIGPLDQRIRLLPGRVLTVAAPTGQGKTSLAECIADRIAQDGGQVLYWSGEVPADQMQDRRIARLTGLPLERLEAGTLSDGQLQTYMDVSAHIAGWSGGVHMYDRSVSATDLCLIAARQKATVGLDLLVVDHLQLLRKAPKQSGYEAITDACKMIKQCGLDLRVPVIQLSQLSREFYHGAEKRPHTWHLKESGEIENSSDAVLLMWLDEAAELVMRAAPGIGGGGESVAVEMHCAIDKNRQGRTGDFALTYIGGRFQFRG